MSEDHTITGEFIFDELTADSTMKGVLILTSKESILLDGIDISLHYEVRGRLNGIKSKPLFVFTVAKNTQLQKNERVEIPFQYTLRTHFFESYVGKNVSLSYNCVATLKINEKDIDKVDLGFYEKMIGFIFSDSPYVLSSDFQLKYPSFEYQVMPSKGEFGVKTGELPTLIFLVIAALVSVILWQGGIVEYLEQKFDVSFVDYGSYFLFGFLLLLFLGFVIKGLKFVFNKLVEMGLGTAQIKVKKSEDGFACLLQKQINFKLEDQNISYNIVELVEDNRGTSSNTYTEVIYSSKKEKVSEFKNSNEVILNYPERTGLETKTVGDAFIYWELIFSGRYLGLNFNYSYKFDVEAV